MTPEVFNCAGVGGAKTEKQDYEEQRSKGGVLPGQLSLISATYPSSQSVLGRILSPMQAARWVGRTMRPNAIKHQGPQYRISSK